MIQRRKDREERHFVDEKLTALVVLITLLLLVLITQSERIAFSPPPGAINVSGCQILNQSGEYYYLTQDIETDVDCMYISAPNIVLDGNGFTIRHVPSADGYGISVFATGDNATLLNLRLEGFGRGVYSGSSLSEISIINSSFHANTLEGIVIQNVGTLGVLSNVLINGSGGPAWDALVLGADVADATYLLENVTIVNSSVTANDLRFSSNASQLILKGGTIGRYDFVGPTRFVVVDINENSSIVFTSLINGSGQNLTGAFDVSYNYVFVDSLDSVLNASANITFTGLPVNLDNMTILRDGAVCPLTICTNHTSLNAGIVTFEVTGFSNYTIVGQDLTPPVVSIIAPQNVTYNASDFPLVFNVSASDNASVWYSLDGGITNETMTSFGGTYFTDSVSSLSGGVYTFRVFANDSAGNVNNSETVVFGVASDVIAPGVSIFFPVNGSTYGDIHLPLTFSVTLSENGSVSYSLDGGSTNITMNTSDNVTFTSSNASIGNGTYIFSVYANDSAGNVNNSAFTVFTFDSSFVADTTAPLVSIVHPQQNGVYRDDFEPAEFRIVLNEVGRAWYSLNNGTTNVSMNTSDNLTFTKQNTGFADGNYTFFAYANDSSGNSNYSINISFSVNTSLPPLITIISPVDQEYDEDEMPLDVIALLGEVGTGAWYSIDNGVINLTMNTTDNRTYSKLDVSFVDGDYTLKVYATDSDGNTNHAGAVVSFSVDTTDNPDSDDDGSSGGSGGLNICGVSVAFSCTPWSTCSAAGTQTRTCSRINAACQDAPPSSQQTCTPITSGTPITETDTSSSTSTPLEIEEEASTMTVTIIFTLLILIISSAIIIVVLFIIRASHTGLGVNTKTGKSSYIPPRSFGEQSATGASASKYGGNRKTFGGGGYSRAGYKP